MAHVVPILLLSAVCGLWVLFQFWIARHMPGAPGIERRCDGCHRDGRCVHDGSCERPETGEGRT